LYRSSSQNRKHLLALSTWLFVLTISGAGLYTNATALQNYPAPNSCSASANSGTA
jgi:hypothetical protein